VEHTVSAPEPTKVQVSVSDSAAIEWAVARRMRLVEVRQTTSGHLAVMEKFDDWDAPDGFPLIKDGRIDAGDVYLRYLQPGDADLVYECDTDALSRRWALTSPPTRQYAENVARRGYLDWRLSYKSALTIVQSCSNTPVGLIKVRKLVPPGVADVGYQVHERYRGLGYAVHALQMFCTWAHQAQLFHRFELGIKPGNTASVRVAEKAGFVFEGRRSARLVDVGGGYSDELHYAKVITAKCSALVLNRGTNSDVAPAFVSTH
jgi:RimJ/RimL family protein N-acetyltransferase